MSSKTKPTATKEAATPALVPKKRFPEFRGAAAWLPYVLEELEDLGWVELGRGEVISGQDIKAIPGDYPIYSSSVKNNGLMGTYGRFMFDEELISWSVDGGGDFFHRPWHKFSVTNVSGYMRLDTSHLDYRFLASHLQALHASLTFDYQFKAHPSVIRKLYRLAIPSPAEQQKIAECLSSMDDLLAAQARKLDALKIHKKGLMEQLFPIEGETQPRLRFPEFQYAGEWEAKKLGQLATYTKGFAFKSQDYKNEGIRIVRVSDLGPDFIKPNNEKIFISSESQHEYTRYKLTASEIIVTTVGSKPELIDSAVGRGIYVKLNNEGLLNQNLLKLEVLPGVNSRFLFSHINTPEYQRFIASISRGNANQANIAVKDLMGFMIKAPHHDEQQRIASCLTSLDELIAAQTQKLEALKTHKKGLMQQLFPSPEEVEA